MVESYWVKILTVPVLTSCLIEQSHASQSYRWTCISINGRNVIWSVGDFEKSTDIVINMMDQYITCYRTIGLCKLECIQRYGKKPKGKSVDRRATKPTIFKKILLHDYESEFDNQKRRKRSKMSVIFIVNKWACTSMCFKDSL